MRRNADIEHERAVAIADLLGENSLRAGLRARRDRSISIWRSRRTGSTSMIRSTADESSETIVLPLAPFRSIVKDYFIVCESYYAGNPRVELGQIEAIDVGRRSLHDEGSALLMERLADKVAIDHDTARRLFTLICVLHLRG